MGSRVVLDEAGLRQLFDSVDGPAGKAVKKAAIRVHRRAKHLAPVDTGRLCDSITEEMGRDERGLVAVVGTDVQYAGFVEFGTSRMRPKPFLRPALDAVGGSL